MTTRLEFSITDKDILPRTVIVAISSDRQRGIIRMSRPKLGGGVATVTALYDTNQLRELAQFILDSTGETA